MAIPKVAAIHDLSGLGKCSLTAAIPILSVCGVQAVPLATAVLSNQTGYDKYTFFDFTPHLKEYVGVWKDMGVKFDCVYSGFLSNAEQGEIILDLYENCGAPGARLVIDPVMGDDGVVYDTFDDRLCDEVKKLAVTADIITPNLTEACMLAGVGYGEFISGLTEENFYDAHYALAEKCAAVCKGYQKKHVLRIGKLHGNSCLAQGIAGFRAAVTPRRRINRYFGAVKPGYAVFAGAVCLQKFKPGKFT